MKFVRVIRELTKNNIFSPFLKKIPINLFNCVIIFHGTSCAGKSYITGWLKRRYKGSLFIEMDHFLYNRVLPDPDIFRNTLGYLLGAGVPVLRAEKIVRKIQAAELIEGKYPRHRSMVELLKACVAHDTVISTCADLPAPHSDNGYYETLGRCTSKTVLHVLIAPESKLLLERLRMRGREPEMDKWFARNKWRLRNQEYYDLVLFGVEPASIMVKLIKICISDKQDG